MFKKVRRLLLAAALLLPLATQAQVTSATFSTGTDATRWITLSANATSLTFDGEDDGVSSVVNIGFPFYFGQGCYAQFSCNTNGIMRLGTEVTSSDYYNAFSAQNVASNLPKLTAYGRDHSVRPTNGHYVKYELTGTAPNRILVVETRQSNGYSASDATIAKYQVQLYEASSKLVFVYDSNTGSMSSSQVGMAASATDLLTINTANNTVANGISESTVNTWPGIGRYYEFTPTLPTCLPPAWASVPALTATTAVLNWLGSASSYVLEYSSTSFTPGTSAGTLVSNITDTTTTLTGLNPNTTYYAYLHADCGAGDTSFNISTVFTTPCVPVAVDSMPYSEGFESGAVSACWYQGYGSYNNTTVSSASAASGTHSLEMSAYNTDYAYVSLGLFEDLLSNYVLSFKSRAYNAGYYGNIASNLYVGYVTNATDISTFVPLDTIAIPASDEWANNTVDLSSITDTNVRLTFYVMGPGNYDYSGAMIDNVTVMAPPSCPSVYNVVVNGVSAAAATVAWRVDNGSTNVPTGYNVVYTDTLGTSQTVTATASPATLTMLTPGMPYTAVVTPDCGSDGYGYADSVSFVAASLPCSVYGPADTTIIGTGLSSSYYYPIASNYFYTFTEMLYTPEEMGGDTMNITSFSLHRDPAYSMDVNVLSDVDIYFANVDSNVTNLATNFIQQDSTFQLVRHGLNLSGTGWLNFELNQPFHYDGHSNLLVVINSHISDYNDNMVFFYTSASNMARRIRNDYAGAYDPATVTGGDAISNRTDIRFLAQQCATLSNCAAPAVSVAAIADTSANIVWAPGYQETEWNVYYKVHGTSAWQLAATEVATNGFTINGLTGGTKYDVAVMGICEDSLMGTTSFTTGCGPVYRQQLPYLNSFSAYASNTGVPYCWTRSSINSESPAVTFTIGRNALQFESSQWYGYTSMIASPEIEMGADSLEVVFDAYKSSASDPGDIVIGVMTDPAEDATFVPVDTVTVFTTNAWSEMESSLASYTGTGHYVALRYTGDEYGAVYVSNMQILRRSSCRKPSAAYATNITYESADVALLDADNTDASSYVLYYGTTNDRTAATDSVVFTGLSTTLTGLNYQTNYYGWVRVQCSDANSRYRAFTFRTLPPCMEVSDLTCQASVDNGTAVLSWFAPEEGFTVTNYIVGYKDMGSSTWITDTITDNYYLISGLPAGTGYDYKVTTLCDTTLGTENSGRFSMMSSCSTLESNGATNTYIPCYSYYNFGYNQSLYTSAEMASMGDTIRGVFYNAAEVREAKTFSLDVYMGNTALSSFADNTSWIPADSLMRVAHNLTFNVNEAGWVYVPFDTVFVRNHASNVVVAIDNNTGSYTSNSPVWAMRSTPGSRSLEAHSDGTNFDPATITGGTARSMVPAISFNASCSAVSTCGTPMLINTAKTAHSLTMRWYAGAAETAWTIDYRIAGDTVWTNFLTNTALTTSTLSGLANGTLYEVRLTNSCSTDSTYFTIKEFGTSCGTFALPYVENFTAQPDGEYARLCWSTGSDGEGYPSVMNLASFGKMMTLADGAYVIAPNFTSPVNDLQMHLDFWGLQRGESVYVGVITDPSSIQTFVPIDTLTAMDPSLIGTRTVHFDGYSDTVGNICIFMPAGHPVSGYFFVDNLEIGLSQNCPDVDSVAISNVTGTSADVAWRINSFGTASSYLMEYGPAGFVPGTGTTVSVTGVVAQLTGLAHSTYYDVRVTPICSTGDTMYNSGAYRFQTTCNANALPYSENFDVAYLPALTSTGMLPPCWRYDMVTSDPYYTAADALPQIIYDEDYMSSLPNTMRMVGLSTVAMPEMMNPVDTLILSFHAYAPYSDYSLIVGVVDSVTPGFSASFVPVDTIDCVGGVYDTIAFCGFAGTGQYIAFQNINVSTWGGEGASIYLDDIVVTNRPSCMPVTGIACDSASMTMMEISWNSCVTPQGYEVEYGAHGFALGQGTTLSTTTNEVTISGLVSATQYDVYVRSICSAGDTAAWMMSTLSTTPCNGYVEEEMRNAADEATTTGYLPGYATYNYSYTQVVYDSAMMAAAGFSAGSEISAFAFYPLNVSVGTYFDDCRVMMKNTTKTVFSSNTDFDSMTASNLVYTGTLNWNEVGWRMVNFDSVFVWDGSSNVIVAVDRDDGDWASGGMFKAVTASATRGIYAYSDGTNVDPYTLSGVDATNRGNTANIPVYKLFGCPGVSCEAPAVTLSAHTYEQATLTWTGTATSYEVNVKATTASVWPADVAVSALTYTATGLQPATEYNFRVRAICDATTQSEWTVGTFVTDSLPCFAPTALTADPDFGTVTMNWTVGTSETQWNLHVWNTTYDSLYIASANPITVGGLTPGVTYNAAVAAVCGGGIIVSDYSDTISFTTVVCAPVTGVTMGTVTGTTAQVSWTAGANNTGSYQIEYGYADFASGDGTIVNATTNSATLTGLEGETSYDVYVRAVCDSQYPSVWSDKASFETPAVGIHTVDGAANVTIYPNPATDGTTVSVSGVEGEVSVTIVDMNGRTVSTHTMNCSGDCVKQMNVSSLASGAYFVRIQGEGLNVVKKLVVK